MRSSVDKFDAKEGGSWRILNRDNEGNEFAFHGVYHEVTPKRIVYTFEWEGLPDHVVLGIVTFEDVNGKTKLTEKSIFESVGDREGMLKSGMEEEHYGYHGSSRRACGKEMSRKG